MLYHRKLQNTELPLQPRQPDAVRLIKVVRRFDDQNFLAVYLGLIRGTDGQ